MAIWKVSLGAAVLIATSGFATIASAQVRAPVKPLSSTAPVVHKIPSRGEMPVLQLQMIRFNPAQLHRWGGKLTGVSRQEGDLDFRYEGNQITHESITHESIHGNLQGRYIYDRDGRFDRIEYNDGTSLTAQYGNKGELISLSSTSGRTIGFYYGEEEADGTITAVTPTENSLEFHSAVAVLRMKQLPVWIPMLQERIRIDENPQPSTPAGEIVVTGKKDPSGVDLIPIGGPGPYRGGGGDVPLRPSDVKDLIDLYRRERLIASCLSGCEVTYRQIERGCATGPTFSQRMECMDKAIDFQGRCDIACNTGDYTHEWQLKRPPPDYFPWRRK